MASSRELVGRSAELHALEALVEGVASRSTLLLSGEAGVGKTALLDAAAATAERLGLRVLRAEAAEFETTSPFAGLNQVFLPFAAEIARLDSPAVHGLRVALGLAEGSNPSPVLVATGTLLALDALAGHGRLLLAVDDAQWLDDASRDVLASVARRARGTRIRIVWTLRTPGAVPRSYGHFEELRVLPLRDDMARALLQRRRPELLLAVRDRVVAEAQGNPLALVELSGDTGARVPVGDARGPLPLTDRLRALFGARIAALPAPARETLLLLALDEDAGVRTVVDALARDVADDLRRAEAAEVVEIIAAEPRFRHPLLRAAVVDAADPPTLRHAHARLAVAWAGTDAKVAWHRADAAVGADETVAAMLEAEAHRNRARGDASAAAAAMRRAAELTPEPRRAAERLARTAALAAELLRDLPDVPGLLATARTLDPDGRGLDAAAATAAVVLYNESDVPSALRIVREALDDVARSGRDPSEDELRAFMRVYLGAARLAADAVVWRDFRDTVRHFGDRVTPTTRLAAAISGDPLRADTAAVAELDRDIAALPLVPDPNRVVDLARLAASVDRLSACREALAQVREGAQDTASLHAEVLLARAALADGRWDECVGIARTREDRAAALGSITGLWYTRFCAAAIAAARGTLGPDLLARLDEVSVWGTERGAWAVPRHVEHARVLAGLASGDYEAAWRTSLRIAPNGADSNEPMQFVVVFDQIEAAVRSGRHEEGRYLTRSLLRSGAASVSPRWAMLTAAAEGLVGSGTEAVDAFRRALDAAPAGRWPFERARVELAFGELLRRERRAREARVVLDRALDRFRALDAGPWIDRTLGEHAATGAHRTDALLTPQEDRVARMAARGVTDRAIAEQLHLSIRTVNGHLSRVYRKLGIGSRGGLPAALADVDADDAEGLARTD